MTIEPPPESTSRLLDRLGTTVRDSLTGNVVLPLSMARRDQLVIALASPSREIVAREKRSTSWLVAIWGVAAVLVIGLCLIIAVRDRRALSVEWTAENAIISPDGHVRAARLGSDAMLGFAGGARVALAEGGHLRLVDPGARPARIVLEEGRASATCEAFPQPSIVIEAGPYSLLCGHAAFDVRRVGARLEVRVHTGTVTVKGAAGAKDVTLDEGGSFVAGDQDLKRSTSIEP